MRGALVLHGQVCSMLSGVRGEAGVVLEGQVQEALVLLG